LTFSSPVVFFSGISPGLWDIWVLSAWWKNLFS